MKGPFAPAVALMNRLTYPKKFALISVLFVAPLAFIMTALLHEISQVATFSQKEEAGLQYLRPLRSFLDHALQLKLAAYADLDGKAPLAAPVLARLQDAIDADLRALAARDESLGGELQSAARLGTIRERWQALKAAAATSRSAAGVARELNPLIPEIRDLIQRIGDTSNLILDPEVDSYYLAAGLVRDVPENQDLTAQIFILAEQTHAPSSNAEAQLEINTLRHVLSSSTGSIPDAINQSLKGTHSATLAQTLSPALAAFRADSQNFLALLDSLNFSDQRLPEYQELGHRALAASFTLWDRMADGLEDLLRARLAAKARQKDTVLAVSGAAFLVVLYLWMGFYLAVMRMVSRLGEASRRMQGGHFDEVPLDSHDELAEVVRSFNKVATSLKESEERLRIVLDSSPVPLLITRFPDGQVLYANKTYADLLGYVREDLLHRTAPDLYHDPSQRPKVHAELQAHGRLREFELASKRADGSPVWVSMSVQRIRFQDSDALLVGLYDLTERRRAEAALRESEERLRTVLDSSPVPFSITRFPDGQVLYINKTYADFLGYPLEQLQRGAAPDLYYDPSLRPAVHAELRAHGRLREFEMPMKHADGHPVWVSMSLQLIPFQDGRATLGALYDLTERRRAEAALRESEDRFRAIAEATPIPVSIAHVDDHRIVYSNRAVGEMLGLPAESIIGRDAQDFYCNRGDRIRMLAELKARGSLRNYEVRLQKADHTAVWTAISSTPIAYDGEACVLLTFYDLEARKQLELDLKRAAETLKAANASLALSRNEAEIRAERSRLTMLRYQLNPHFLFNSLNTIRSFILGEPEKAREMVTRLVAFCRLALTYPETGTTPLREEWTLLENYLAMEKFRWGERLAIEIALDPAVADTLIPPFLLQPLVENAIKYGQRTSPGRLAVRLSARRAAAGIEIEIANSGRWLEPDDHDAEGTQTGLANLRERLFQHHPGVEFAIGQQGDWVVARIVLPG